MAFYWQQYLLCACGSRNRSARRQRALFSSSQVRQGVLNVGVLAPFNLTFLLWRKQTKFRDGGRGNKGRNDELFSAAHLLLFDASLQCFYVVLYSHVDESVLGLSLHHPRALRTNHLDGLWHIDVTVHPCSIKTILQIDASSELVTTFEVNWVHTSCSGNWTK